MQCSVHHAWHLPAMAATPASRLRPALPASSVAPAGLPCLASGLPLPTTTPANLDTHSCSTPCSRDDRDEERLEELRALNRATKEETGEYMSSEEIAAIRPPRWTGAWGGGWG